MGIAMRLTRRFIVKNIKDLNISSPIRYERYYINDNLRIQRKDGNYEKEILDSKNNIIEKLKIDIDEFSKLKENAYSKIVRDSYLFLDDNRVSIKKYYDTYEGLIRVEVQFQTLDEMNSYLKEWWMEEEITNSPLAFDKYLSKLNREEFLHELNNI